MKGPAKESRGYVKFALNLNQIGLKALQRRFSDSVAVMFGCSATIQLFVVGMPDRISEVSLRGCFCI
jgi:hypothetical protein